MAIGCCTASRRPSCAIIASWLRSPDFDGRAEAIEQLPGARVGERGAQELREPQRSVVVRETRVERRVEALRDRRLDRRRRKAAARAFDVKLQRAADGEREQQVPAVDAVRAVARSLFAGTDEHGADL